MIAAKSDNETQFVEVNKVEVAHVLYPDIKTTDRFLGIVKSEPERYTAYGESVLVLSLYVHFVIVFLHQKIKVKQILVSLKAVVDN